MDVSNVEVIDEELSPPSQREDMEDVDNGMYFNSLACCKALMCSLQYLILIILI